MENLKYGVWVLWFGSTAMVTLGSGWVVVAGHLAFWSTLVAHLAEFAVKRSVMVRAGGSMTHHFVQTLIYGLFHWKPLEESLDQGASSSEADS